METMVMTRISNRKKVIHITFRVGRVPEVPVAEAVRAGAAVAGLLRAAARARGVSPQPRLLLAAVPQVVIILGDVIHVGGD